MLLKRNKYQVYSDNELIEMYRTSKKSALIGELYLRYGHLVMGTAMKYLKNQQEAEDITMVIFETLPDKIIRHQIKYFKSWLYMVCKNECLMMLRKKGKVEVEIEEQLLQSPDENNSVYEKEEQLSRLESAVEKLKEVQRICIKHFYLEQKSYQEISNELNISIKKVKSAIQNGKRNLKIIMEGNHEN